MADFARYYKSHGYTAVTDMPSVLFDARIVLSHHPRGIPGWLNSMKTSILPLTSWGIWDWLLVKYDEFFCRQYIPMLRRVLEIWSLETPWPGQSEFSRSETALREFHESHLEQARTLAKQQGREVLEFNPKMGWEPLCKFLGKDVPAEPYPFINEARSFVRLHFFVVWCRTMVVLSKYWLPIVGGTAAMGLAAFWIRR